MVEPPLGGAPTCFGGAVTGAERFGVGMVIVNRQQVGHDVFPTVVTDDGPGGVERFGEVVERPYRVPLLARER